ncbi:hypothetical protein F4782DRAFT_547552 [Xylaria castorea]|nr:hypothetical protein F4782DRAFT_547552 [Xylaria castorea]
MDENEYAQFWDEFSLFAASNFEKDDALTIDYASPHPPVFALDSPPTVERYDPPTINPAALQIHTPTNGFLLEQQQQLVWEDQNSLAEPYGEMAVSPALDNLDTTLNTNRTVLNHGAVATNVNGQNIAAIDAIDALYGRSNTSASCSTPSPTIHCLFEACDYAAYSEGAMHEHTSSSHVGDHFAVAQFKCHCGKEFTKKFSLDRHVENSVPMYPCDECDLHDGEYAFKRKDQLQTHLKRKHNQDDDQIAAMFPPRKIRNFRVLVCPVEGCSHYRCPDFKYRAFRDQWENRPFTEQSDYMTHMMEEHNWSRRDKINGNGYLNTKALETHSKATQPGSPLQVLVAEDQTIKSVKCGYCQKSYAPDRIAHHQKHNCQGKVECDYCHEHIDFRRLDDHHNRHCIKQVPCSYCHKFLQSRQLAEHELARCTALGKCAKCSKWMERQQLGLMGFCRACCQ